MRITAIDLTHKKLAKGFRGYRVAEVDDLLRDVASVLEEAARDRARLEEQMESIRADISRYKEMEMTLNSAILLAQRAADDLKANAGREADLIVTEAQQKARRIGEEGRQEHQDLLTEIRRLRERRDIFLDALTGSARDLGDWLEHRRWEEVIASPTEDCSLLGAPVEEAGVAGVSIAESLSEAAEASNTPLPQEAAG